VVRPIVMQIADVVRSLAFYALFYGGTVLLLVVATLVLVLRPSAFLAVADGWSAWHRGCVRHILGIEIELQGTLPEGRFFVAVKHESFFEAIDAPQFIARPAVFAKAELMRLPLWGRLARNYGLIGVERDRGAKALREMIAAAKQLAAEGRTLAIYPEGTRVPHATRAPLQAGFAAIYKLLDLPVVPVAVNSGPLYHRVWKRKGTLIIRIGEPIPPGLPRAEVERRVLDAINALEPDN
jgi:1-acyl-sn-glycerol-3-phosphate acyltransferase